MINRFVLEQVLFFFVSAILISYAAVPSMIKIANKYNITDKPNQDHKTHSEPVPYLGGIAIAVSVFTNYFIMFQLINIESFVISQSFAIFSIGVTILILGLIDDVLNLSAKAKLGIQFGLTSAALSQVINSDLYIDITNSKLLDYFIALIWILGITNAVNLLHNLDGAVPLTSFISFTSLGIICINNSNFFLSIQSFIFAGASFGFFFWNRSPASIYLGDSGSLFIGYNISMMLLLNESTNVPRFVSLSIPILLVAMPILDMSIVIVHRSIKGKPLFVGDKNHISHRLLSRGFSKRKTLFFILTIHSLFATLGIFLMLNYK